MWREGTGKSPTAGQHSNYKLNGADLQNIGEIVYANNPV
jgi:hypothetical protein